MQAVIDFLNTADNSDKVLAAGPGQRAYQSYKHTHCQWELLKLILNVINDSARVQQSFSSEKNPLIPCILPALLDFCEKWASLLDNIEYTSLHTAIQKGVDKIDKYYGIARKAGPNAISLCNYSSLSLFCSLKHK